MDQGLTVLVTGMTAVFAFLIMLVVVMHISARFFRKFGHLFPELDSVESAPDTADLSDIAVILAVLRVRSR
jgi:Na+-transporting methylmalonyl-CoA/oxaloacetate decarboxylase gamma subunit